MVTKLNYVKTFQILAAVLSTAAVRVNGLSSRQHPIPGPQSAGAGNIPESAHGDDELMTRVRTCIMTYADSLDSVRQGLGDGVRSHPLKAERTSDRKLIFGVGSGTTGTRSLKTALQLLGMHGWHRKIDAPWVSKIYSALGGSSWRERSQVDIKTETQRRNCYSKLRQLNYNELPDDVDFVLDEPIPETFIDIFLNFPNSKYILSKRPWLQWARARAKEHGAEAFPPIQEPCGETFYDYNISENAALQGLHLDLIKCVVPPDNLFKFDLFAASAESLKSLMHNLAEFVHRPLKSNVSFPTSVLRAANDRGEPCDSDLSALTFDAAVQAVHGADTVEYTAEDLGLFMHALAVGGCELWKD